MSMHMGRVMEVLPELGGIRVEFEDLVPSGFGSNDYVRVLQPRMSPEGGAFLWLPQVGEMGVVGRMDGGSYVWLGSLPYQHENQVDPTPGILYLRHQSGATVQLRQNGDMEVRHPSGTRLTLAAKAGALPALAATTKPVTEGNTAAPTIQLSHASGAMVQIDGNGNGSATGFKSFNLEAAGTSLEMPEGKAGQLHGFSSFKFQDGSGRFAMDTLVDWINNTLETWANGHTHICGAGGWPSMAPQVPISVLSKDAVCSPATFTGPTS